jgi:hypothetical protein
MENLVLKMLKTISWGRGLLLMLLVMLLDVRSTMPEPSPHEEGCECEWCYPQVLIRSIEEFDRLFFPAMIEERRLANETPDEAAKRLVEEAIDNILQPDPTS